ncbi:MAG: methylated-DNA--[protein]-cysteine S-methyltransferase [Actinomycetia bacterium]|nr:methylated-DNA--[protein]-cysteine S-methyltransferase [Actinomycetes bacterium]
MNVHYYEYPVGVVGIEATGDAITGIFFGNRKKADDVIGETSVIKSAATQLDEYFAGNRKGFDLPLCAHGTSFQQSVWKALCSIPYGETRSYGEVARAVGNANAFRAVGAANHCNPIAIVVPCHRVVRQGGSLGGYAGGLDIKKYLLELEKSCSFSLG